jgi:hypothetical protein
MPVCMGDRSVKMEAVILFPPALTGAGPETCACALRKA